MQKVLRRSRRAGTDLTTACSLAHLHQHLTPNRAPATITIAPTISRLLPRILTSSHHSHRVLLAAATPRLQQQIIIACWYTARPQTHILIANDRHTHGYGSFMSRTASESKTTRLKVDYEHPDNPPKRPLPLVIPPAPTAISSKTQALVSIE